MNALPTSGFRFDNVDVGDFEITMRCHNRGTNIETWDAFIFYKGAPRQFVVFPRRPTRQEAIDTAAQILSSRESLGAYMLGQSSIGELLFGRLIDQLDFRLSRSDSFDCVITEPTEGRILTHLDGKRYRIHRLQNPESLEQIAMPEELE